MQTRLDSFWPCLDGWDGSSPPLKERGGGGGGGGGGGSVELLVG
jgi:hypothetical protein